MSDCWRGVSHLTTANQGHDDASADDESQDESIGSVPPRSPAHSCSLRVGKVHANKPDELSEQRIVEGKQDGWPRQGGSEDSDGVPTVRVGPSVFGHLQTPVDGAEETVARISRFSTARVRKPDAPEDDSPKSNLCRLQELQKMGCRLFADKESHARLRCIVDVPCQVQGGDAGDDVWSQAAHPEPEHFLRNFIQRKRLLDRLLPRQTGYHSSLQINQFMVHTRSDLIPCNISASSSFLTLV